MKHQPLHPAEPWESDPVWQLLDQVPPATAGPRFLANTLRAARLAGQPSPWWKSLVWPAPFVGLAGATAAVVFSMMFSSGPTPDPTNRFAGVDSTQAEETIQDIAETEILMVAVDHLDDFSDTELVSLIGF